MTTYPVRTRRWTRAEYDRPIEYGILNLEARVLEVYRDPAPSAAAPFGWRYRIRQRLAAAAHVVPRHAPAARIAVSDLLP